LSYCLLLLAQFTQADVLDDYMALATGSFSTAAQAATDSRYDAVTWHVAEIWADRDANARWLYSESWLDDAKRPYMQRLSRISANADGSLRAERFRVPDASRFTGAHADVTRFKVLGRDDLDPVSGCDAILVRAGADRFEGGTVGKQCQNAYNGASYALSHTTLHADGMTNWDRGFTASGELAWGPASGGYRFLRVTAGKTCAQPVRMLVFGEIRDRQAFFAYVSALAEAGLYEEYGGYYEGITPALDVFEGDPPPTRGVVISRFPCLEAAQAFWQSEEYAAIKPLRAGIAEFEVLVLPAPPLPAWAETG
jgi:uncharacterized protein (DUF1330 family)